MEVTIKEAYHTNGILIKKLLLDAHNNYYFHSIEQYITKNGTLQGETIYRKSDLYTHKKEWHKNGQFQIDVKYKNTKDIGIGREWYKNGQIRTEIEYTNGNIGNRKLWNREGILENPTE